MDKINVKTSLGIGSAIFVIVVVALYNISISLDTFLSINIYQVLSLLFAIIITFLLTQKKNDYRRKIDMMDKMIVGIQEDIADIKLVSYRTEEERKIALLKQKSLANRIEYLKENGIHKATKEEVEYVSKEVERLREFYGSHMEDMEYMDKSSADIEKYVVNINDKCFAIRLKLYD